MLFKELVEQHRVYRVVANGVNLAVLIAHHQIGTYLSHFLGDQTELGRAGLVALVVKSHWPKPQQGFAGVVHRFNLVLEAARGTCRAELAIGVDYNGNCVRVSCCDPPDADDKRTVLSIDVAVADADGAGLASNTSVGDVNIVTARREKQTGVNAQCDVAGPGCVVLERIDAQGRVQAGVVVLERRKTDGRVVVAGYVAKERASAIGRVGIASGVVDKGAKSLGGVSVGGIVKECLSPHSCILDAGGKARECLKTNRRVVGTGGETEEGSSPPLGRVGAQIAPVRCRANRLRSW